MTNESTLWCSLWYSWEIGTAMETILELDFPELSVLSGKLPPPQALKSGEGDYVIQTATE